MGQPTEFSHTTFDSGVQRFVKSNILTEFAVSLASRFFIGIYVDMQKTHPKPLDEKRAVIRKTQTVDNDPVG